MNKFPDISRSKGNQIKKFGQLTEYNMKIIFLETSCGAVEKLVPDLRKNQNQFSRSTVCSFIQFFLLYVQIEDYQNILQLVN